MLHQIMLALRQQACGLARLAQLLQPQLPLACAALQQAAWQQQQAAPLHASAAAAALGGGGGGITGWLTNKVGGMLGAGDLEDLTLQQFGDQMKMARRIGGLSGFVHGTSSIQDGAAQGTLRLFSQIVE